MKKDNKQIIEVEYIVHIGTTKDKYHVKITTAEFKCYMDAKAFIEGLPKDRVLTEVGQLPIGDTNFTTNKIDDEIMMSDVD